MKSISGQLTLLSPVEDEVDSVRCPGIWRRNTSSWLHICEVSGTLQGKDSSEMHI